MVGLTESDIFLINEIFLKYPQIEEALLFGSRAKGTHKRGSDVDIALKGKNLIDIAPAISGFLNDETPLPYLFDVVDYHSLSNQNLKEHINRVGIVIYPYENSD